MGKSFNKKRDIQNNKKRIIQIILKLGKHVILTWLDRTTIYRIVAQSFDCKNDQVILKEQSKN